MITQEEAGGQLRPSQETQGLCFCLRMAQTQFSSEIVRVKWHSGQCNTVLCYTLVPFSTARRGAELLGREADGARSWC